MARVVISEKYLYDIANAIRVKLDSQSTYTPAQMAAAIADITGSITGSITPSTVTSRKLITDTYLTAIANAIRAKLDVDTLYTPAQMANAILSIESAAPPVPTIASWADGTDEEVSAMIDAAHAGTLDLQQDGGWAVGDVRTISIAAFTCGGNVAQPAQTIDIVISSFDEYMNSGNVLQFDFKDELSQTVKLNDSSTNVGGYGASEMKTVTLPALVNAMPNWIKTRLVEFSVLTSAGNNSSIIENVTGNKLALRSIKEIYGSAGRSYDGEGLQVPYYTLSGSTIKKQGHAGRNNAWWSRSPAKNATSYVQIDASGFQDQNSAGTYSGIAPFGCL